MNFKYQMGEVSGGVFWEQVQLGGFGIGYQAFGETRQFTLDHAHPQWLPIKSQMKICPVETSPACSAWLVSFVHHGCPAEADPTVPANSIIMNEIPGVTSGAPDGATFLDNLFGSGLGAPTQRLFSLSLERREDVRT